MPSKSSIVVVVLLLALSTLGVGRPVRAAPAQPYAHASCETGTNEATGVEYESCAADRGVYQLNVLPSGEYQYISNGRLTYTERVNGGVVYTDELTFHFTDVFVAGDYQVVRARTIREFSFADPESGLVLTCRTTYNLVSSNGEVRHETNIEDCTTS
jgi:hypothetical protein